MWPGMRGQARRAGAGSPPARASLAQPGACRLHCHPPACALSLEAVRPQLPGARGFLHFLRFYLVRASRPSAGRALFLPRTPAALHGTPHSTGHAITDPSIPGAAAGWTVGFGPGPIPGTPARGGGTPGQGDYHRRKKPVSGPGAGAGAARH